MVHKRGWQLLEREGEATSSGFYRHGQNRSDHPNRPAPSDSRRLGNIRLTGCESSAESEISGSQWNDTPGERRLVDRDAQRS